jgi:diacylglycerol O-acyltransferase / wax synthase
MSSRGLKKACGVSRAHLTCDPGDVSSGYNCVVAVLRFRDVLSGPDFRELFMSSVVQPAAASILTHRMSFEGGKMRWEPMGTDWDPESHIRIVDSISCDLETRVSELMTTPLDLTRPCWEVEFIESISRDSPASVCVMKYHHCLADGFTMVQQMLARMEPVSSDSRPVIELIPSKRAITVATPSIWNRLGAFWSILKSTGKLLFIRRDPPGVFRSAVFRTENEPIHVGLSDFGGIRVTELKKIATESAIPSISINDVILTILSLSLGSFAEKSTKSISDVTTVIWVSLAREFTASPSPDKWDNTDLGFAYCKLPLSISEPKSCLKVVHERLDKLKGSMEPFVINTALRTIGKLPIGIGKVVAPMTADCASLSVSNIAGPTEQVRWPSGKGGVVDTIHFATSPPFRYGLLVSVITYNDNVYMTLSARGSMLTSADLTEIANKHIRSSFEKLIAPLS